MAYRTTTDVAHLEGWIESEKKKAGRVPTDDEIEAELLRHLSCDGGYMHNLPVPSWCSPDCDWFLHASGDLEMLRPICHIFCPKHQITVADRRCQLSIMNTCMGKSCVHYNSEYDACEVYDPWRPEAEIDGGRC